MKLILKEKKQKLKGGVGDKRSLSEFDPKEVELGRAVEREHTKDEAKIDEIVTDHLTEDPHYYSKLDKVGLEEYKSGFGSGKMGDSKHAQGIPSGPKFPFDSKAVTGSRTKRVRDAAKKGPVTAVGTKGISPSN